jgi:hypothetical protein
MNKSMLSFLSLLTALVILSGACAKISSPSGGRRDKLPPVVVKSVPVYGEINFRGKGFSIYFNEYVVLDNINDKFMVSPPLKKKPRVLIKGKSVNVEFDEALKDSTTYTFYFQDAIKDNNEGNILDNYQFVLSTGKVIDSLSVTGNVYNSKNLEVPEKTLVLMYRELADSAVVKHLPEYISRVNPDGYFRINNVRAGKYRLYALKDLDNSKNYNSIEEEFAFMNTPVEITPEKNFLPVIKDTITVKKELPKVTKASQVPVPVPEIVPLTGEFNLLLFAAEKKAHYLTKSSRDLKYQMIYTLSLPPDTMKFELTMPEESDKSYFIERTRNNDTLIVWLADSSLYSKPQITTIVKYPFTDSTGVDLYKKDTVIMRFLAPRVPRGVKAKKPVFAVDANISSGSLKPGQNIILRSKTPFIMPDTSRMRLYELVEPKRIKVPFTLAKDSSNSCRYYLNATFLPGKKYLYIADSASFRNIYNESSDSAGLKFSVRELDSYGKMTLDIHNYEGDRIIQLLDKTENLVSEKFMKKDGLVTFLLLESGFYRLRVIYDLNGDGKWTTGDFAAGRQPEPVSYYFQELELKKGWEIEHQDWDIGIKNFKDQKLREKKKPK